VHVADRQPPFGFFKVHQACHRAVQAALGEGAIKQQHYFQLRWLPQIGGCAVPVREGDELACVITLDERSAASDEGARFRVKQLQLERCRYLSGDDMRNYLTSVHTLSAANADGALMALSKCAAPWRYIVHADAFEPSLSDELVELVLQILHLIFPAQALAERCANRVHFRGRTETVSSPILT
jgi:hypothetical protein